MLKILKCPKIEQIHFQSFSEKAFPISKSIMCFFLEMSHFWKSWSAPFSHLILNFIWFSSICPHVEKSFFTYFWDISRNPRMMLKIFDDSVGGSLFVTKQTWTYFMKPLSLKILLNITWLLRNCTTASKGRNFPLKSASNQSHWSH